MKEFIICALSEEMPMKYYVYFQEGMLQTLKDLGPVLCPKEQRQWLQMRTCPKSWRQCGPD